MQEIAQTPNLFIIGAPKCGTTSMCHYLDQHPQVFVSPVKEPHYFNKDSKHRYYFSEKDYLPLFKKADASHTYLCEGSVWYLYSSCAIDEILKFNPGSKFIVMLRNPVEMYFALHQELVYGGSEDVKSPIEAWNLQKSRKEGDNIPPGCNASEKLQYGEVCKLGKQLIRLIQKADKRNIKLIFLDELKHNPDLVYQDVLQFLGVTPLCLKTYKIVNPKKRRKFPSLLKMMIAINKLKARLGITKGLGIGKRINSFNVSFDVLLSTQETKLLTPVLREYFSEDITLIERITQKDLLHWKITEVEA